MGFPLSHASATASSSRFSSMRSAMRFNKRARSATAVLPQASLAAWAASRACSMSSAVERGTSQKGLPLTGEGFSQYLPLAGGTHSPPMKFW